MSNHPKTLVDKRELARLRAAEEVCWSLVLAMVLGGLEIPLEWRGMICRGGMDEWVERAAEAGLLARGDDA